MCLWGSWTWHGTYCRSLIKTSALWQVCRDSGYAGLLLIFFSVQVTPAAEHTEKVELQESIAWTTLDTKTLDIRSKVWEERTVDAFYHWVIMSLVLLLLSRPCRSVSDQECQSPQTLKKSILWKECGVETLTWLSHCAVEPLLLKMWSDNNLCSFFPCSFPPLIVLQSFPACLFSHPEKLWN